MTQHQQNQHRALRRVVCAGTRAVEWILCVSTIWAGLVMFWTPTLLREHPPHFFKVLTGWVPAWELGLVFVALGILDGWGLLSTRCDSEVVRGADILHVPASRRTQIAMLMRSLAVLGQVGVWLFFSLTYAMLFFSEGHLTLALGLTLILAVSASVVSFCLSQERARHAVRQSATAKGRGRHSPLLDFVERWV